MYWRQGKRFKPMVSVIDTDISILAAVLSIPLSVPSNQRQMHVTKQKQTLVGHTNVETSEN